MFRQMTYDPRSMLPGRLGDRLHGRARARDKESGVATSVDRRRLAERFVGWMANAVSASAPLDEPGCKIPLVLPPPGRIITVNERRL